MAQRLSPDRRQGDFPGRNRSPKATPAEPLRSDRGPAVPPLGAAGVGGDRSRRERGAFGSSMGTMGPVSAEPGLSLWDAMSVRGARRGRTHRSLGNPPRSAGRAHRDTPSVRPGPRRSGEPLPSPSPSFLGEFNTKWEKPGAMRKVIGVPVKRPPAPAQLIRGPLPRPPKGERAGGARQAPLPLLHPARGARRGSPLPPPPIPPQRESWADRALPRLMEAAAEHGSPAGVTGGGEAASPRPARGYASTAVGVSRERAPQAGTGRSPGNRCAAGPRSCRRRGRPGGAGGAAGRGAPGGAGRGERSAVV